MTEEINETPDEASEAAELDVQKLHEPIIREHIEPHDGFEPVPFWMQCFFGLLVAWGGYYLAPYTRNFLEMSFWKDSENVPLDSWNAKPPAIPKPDQIPTDEAGLEKLGAKIYQNCQACHLTDGNGQGVNFPPLNDSEWVGGKETSTARLARIVLYGLNGPIEVAGKTYNGQMPAWGSQLKDYQIASVLTYIRRNWNNKAKNLPAIWPKDIAAARKKMGTSGLMTVELLRQLSVDTIDEGATVPPKK